MFRSWGNWGDALISAGARGLLRQLPYREYDIRHLDDSAPGDLAVVAGGGSWCVPFPAMPEYLPLVEARFRRVIVFPSSFDTSEVSVADALRRTKAIIFARERQSFEQIQSLCDARLAHDTAFFFDFSGYHCDVTGGVLNVFREDAESGGEPLPEENCDVSVRCSSLDEWLWTISRHRLIRTDRAHVMIAAAMLGRRIEYRPSSYHKVPAIVEYCIPSDLVSPLTAERGWTRTINRLPVEVPPEGRIAKADAERERARAELKEIRRELADLRDSWSWRITAPLRALWCAALAVTASIRGAQRR